MKIIHSSLILFFSVILSTSFQVYAQGIITTIAGNGVTQYIGDGAPATSLSLGEPGGIVMDKAGNILIAEVANLRIRKLSPSGVLSTIAGNGTYGFAGDGGTGSTAVFARPSGIALDTSGSIYISDRMNNRIRKIEITTGIINTVVGNGTGGYTGDGIAATSATLETPVGICIDKFNNLYIADFGNHRVRKVELNTGIISTIAGTGEMGYSGDGGLAINAKLLFPNAVAIDTMGNVYVTEFGNSTVRKIDISTGVISTIAGTGVQGYTGDGGLASAATLRMPGGLFVDDSDNVIVCDGGNNVVRVIKKNDGKIYPVAGSGLYGYDGDGGLAIYAKLNEPRAVYRAADGHVYIADAYNSVIRKLSLVPLGIIADDRDEKKEIVIYPNPVQNGIMHAKANCNISYAITNVLGQVVYKGSILGGHEEMIDASLLEHGVYWFTYQTNIDKKSIMFSVVK